MKNTSYHISLLCILIFLQNLFFISCSNFPLEFVDQSSLYQVAGCNKQPLYKSLQQQACFNYDFRRDLIIDFCASGNCCPDKDRYKLSSAIYLDTITISIRDTAQPLCNCFCNYIIHAGFKNPPGDNYVVKCIQLGANFEDILYIEKVSRK